MFLTSFKPLLDMCSDLSACYMYNTTWSIEEFFIASNNILCKAVDVFRPLKAVL